MLYHLFEYLDRVYDLPGAGLFSFVTFRAALAIVMSLIISMAIGGRIIKWLRNQQVGESIRDLGLDGQMSKKGTPTMGGVIIILAVVIPCFLVARLDSIYIIIMLSATTWMALIGFIDDYIKVFQNDKKGLKGIFKVLGQVGLGLLIGAAMWVSQDVVVSMKPERAAQHGYEVVKTVMATNEATHEEYEKSVWVKAPLTNIPFVKGNNLNYSAPFSAANKKYAWLIFIPMCIFVVTAVSNGANLTDGLDGLATGVSSIIGATLGILAYVGSNSITADYLNILLLPGTEELVIFCGCFVGGTLGFLWHNTYPASVFMGDTGSLTIGGIIAALAILLRKELLLPILCGIFVAENLSVVLQVWYFKYTKKKYGEGRRIFKMAPLHHHYQKLGIPEPKIVTRFWIVGILLAILTMITLKIR